VLIDQVEGGTAVTREPGESRLMMIGTTVATHAPRSGLPAILPY